MTTLHFIHNSLSFFKKHSTLFLLAALLLWGGYLRLFYLGTQSLWIDEGYSINAAQAILEHGTPLLASGRYYNDWLLPNYLIAGSMATFGFDAHSPFSARLPAAMFGIALIAIVFLFAYELCKSRLFAFSAALLTTLSQWEIAWSGQARGYTEASFFILLGLLCTWKFLQQPRGIFAAGAVISCIGAYFSTPLSLLVLPAVGFFWVADTIATHKILQRLGYTLSGFALAGLFAGAIIFFETATTMTRMVHYGTSQRYVSFLTGELIVFTLGSVLAVMLAVGNIKQFRPVLFVFLALVVPVLFISLHSPAVQLRYLFPFFPLALLLTAYTAYRIRELIYAHLPQTRTFRLTTTCLMLGACLVVTTGHLQFFASPLRTLEIDSPQPNFNGAYSFIQQQTSEICTEDLPCTIISPYPHITQIYTGSPGMWLPMSLTGNPSELAWRLSLGVDYYSGAHPIPNDKDLIDRMQTGQGFIVLDTMAATRLPQTATLLDGHSSAKLVYRSGTDFNEIRVYAFSQHSFKAAQ